VETSDKNNAEEVIFKGDVVKHKFPVFTKDGFSERLILWKSNGTKNLNKPCISLQSLSYGDLLQSHRVNGSFKTPGKYLYTSNYDNGTSSLYYFS